ncbi:MAG: peptide-methionine (S)-S-oxide reductase [Stenotrophomonas maltophilia]
MKFSFEQGIAAGVAGLVATALIAGVLLVDHGAIAAPVEASAQTQALPVPTGDAAFRDDATHASVVFAGGCFWGVQGVFQHVKGVSNAVSGYIGGSAANARYERVSSGQTGHAEAVKVDYDPRQVSYGQLMQVFFSVVHDPTQLNRQGPGPRQPVPVGDLH